MLQFKPTEIWTPESNDLTYGDVIETARRAINQKRPKELIYDLNISVDHSSEGVAFSMLQGEHPAEYSNTDAFVMFNPYANGATSNMLLRAEFLREVFKAANIRDDQGKLLPVIMIASPGVNGSNLKLKREDKKAIAQGELGPFAKELLRIVSEQEIGKVALLGFSQGADVALAGARTAYSANLDVAAVSIGDPAGVADRSFVRLLNDFRLSAPDLEERADKSGIRALRPAREEKGEARRFFASLAYPLNRFAIVKGLGVNNFENRVQEIINERKVGKIAVGYGAESIICPPIEIEPAIASLYERNGSNSFISIRVEGAQHTWGDQLTLLAKLYLKALQ
jgi:pimeloyl-ACP methyl ester carboxylesterase